jgi:DNA repair exonuclease SbcCD nuclease subunit
MYDNIFRVVKSHEVIDFPRCPVVFACVSYVDDEEKLKKVVAETILKATTVAGGRKVVLLGHFSVKGAMAHGMEIEDGLDTKDISKVDATFLGHIHKFQEFKPRHFYVGSPFQQNFGELNETKYVMILDTKAGKVYPIDTKMPQYHRHSFDQFEASVVDNSEDRFEVKLKSFQEAEKFYAHPLSHRAVPIYDYIESSPSTSNVESSTPEMSFEVNALMKAYLENNPPNKKGLLTTSEDLLAFGQELMSN